MESTARIKTAKGNKIRVSDIGDFRIVGRNSMMDMVRNFNQCLMEYETEKDFREAFPQSNNDQHFLLAQKKDDALKQRQRDLETQLGPPYMYYGSPVREDPRMAMLKERKLSMQYERYYILTAGSKSECDKYKKKAEKKQNRNETTIRRTEKIVMALITKIVPPLLWVLVLWFIIKVVKLVGQ